VLTVRPTRGNAAILAATDLSDPAVPAVQAAVEEARATGMRLTLMHHLYFGRSIVDALGPLGPVPPQPSADALEATREAALEVLKGLLDRFGVEGDVRATLHADPAAAITGVADELEADLIVVGARGRTGLARIALGSVAESVVRDARCSVLAVRLSSED
jgi:nucleotide-binding universal stress UspA family protein